MIVGLLLITHNRVGEALLDTSCKMLEGSLPSVDSISVSSDCNPDVILEEARVRLTQLDQGRGVLVLTDMYGSTPSNIAFGLAERGRVNVITGVNLPMLIRTLNYQTLDLVSLTEKAISGGKDGIFCCETPNK